MKIKWERRFADSGSNFDLVLRDPKYLDSARMHHLLENIVKETHRGQTLKRRAIEEFRRFFDHPETPLKSYAYVLLSNWFMTGSGDRNSTVASRCEGLWDELFPCRPVERFSSSAPGKNHIMLDSEFQSFWSRVSKAQGDQGAPPANSGDGAPSPTGNTPKFSDGLKLDDRVRATFVRYGLHFQVEGSPSAMAEFLELIR